MKSGEIKISDLMSESGVLFGTSGARGLSTQITDLVAYSYTMAFLQYLDLPEEDKMFGVAGDLRPSTDRIKNSVMEAAADCGYMVVDFGCIPSPAIALHGISTGIPTVMVTGSHIPADRNGIKFTKPAGEISKADEQAMKEQVVFIPDNLFSGNGQILRRPSGFSESDEAMVNYIMRFRRAFPSDLLAGKKIGVYQHSAVGRDIMVEIIESLGGTAVPLGRSDEFIPVDTEAIRAEDIAAAKKWAAEGDFFAIISTDGDSDRPLIADEEGNWYRGDISGILTAQFLNADAVVVPVSCNSAVDKVGFQKVIRTKIGSPYVIAGMEEAAQSGFESVVGYEANGGFLQYSNITTDYGELEALPTRDPIIVHLALMSMAVKMGVPVSKLKEVLPARYTASDRLKEFPVEKSRAVLEHLAQSTDGRYLACEECFSALFGGIKNVNLTDGLRMTFISDEVVHLRPSGNAPEFRCYTEAGSEERAAEILESVLKIMVSWR